jgi:hypothetical protein
MKRIGSLIFILLALVLVGCNKEDGGGVKAASGKSSGAGDWSQGDCIDRALSPYIYQIAEIEGKSVYLYKMGEMGKKIIKKTFEELKEGKEPFTKVPCP